MSLFVIALPRLAAADARRIEALRQRWDPQAALLPAHVTLVFARPDGERESLQARLCALAARVAAFPLRLAGSQVVESGPSPAFYRYLLPQEGAATLRALHGALNSEPLADFQPHVTLGRFADRTVAEAGHADAAAIAADAMIEALRLERLQDGTLTCLAEYPLTGSAAA